MLPFYAQRFATVEINNTMYDMPELDSVAEWAAAVPPGFIFSVKAPQRITHHQRLKNSRHTVEQLLRRLTPLQNRLGPVLFQLPPNFKKDLPRLRRFLAVLPKDLAVT